MIDHQALKNELENDPTNMGYQQFIDSGNDYKLTQLLNEKTKDFPGLIKIGIFSVWMTVNGIRAKFKNGSQNFTNNNPQIQEQIRNLCQDVLDIEKNPHMSVLDMSDANTQTLVQTLVQTGILTQQEVDSLIEKSYFKVSRAEELFGNGTCLSVSDISLSLRGNP